MSALRVSAVLLGAVSLGLAVVAPPVVAEPTEPLPSAASEALSGPQVQAARAAGRIAFVTPGKPAMWP